ncbi:MAG: 50S ribosomal protein L11 methyltransferase [Eubacteriales bacterium]|nr:50S ribosomal protein L11 methyltransferase [Eubacteriales bacterium]MDD3349276.1 50S ribosomal protein L11 methyltransferase [Eubacteriales bacterium]
MDYTEITIFTNKESLDPLSCVITDLGIAGFAVEDPADFEELLNKKNAYDWDYINEEILPQEGDPVRITLHFEDTLEGMELMDLVLEEIRPFDVEKVEIRSVSDNDWKDKWKEYFKPSKVSEHIVVKPSWEPYEATSPDEMVIEIDPGMAFGTGTHPTTSLCIVLLEKYMPLGGDVLDVGCGSGILSIAAEKLGAGKVLGVDIDPVAVQVSLENVALNEGQKKIEIAYGDLTKGISYRADVVVANLMADLVVLLSKDVAKHLKPSGIYISSGILIEKQEMVVAALKAQGFELLEILEKDEWCAIAVKYIAEGDQA